MTDKSQHYIKPILIVLVSALLLVFSRVYKYSDKTFENAYSVIAGERTPDSNIVIIHISESDLEKIGPWPIKRSYYALLIKNLTKQKVNKIGLEVFLSSRLVIQSIYDKLLKNEIEKSGRVVLSSLSGRIIEHDGKFYSDSLSYPSPKLLNENFLTGHLNYIRDNGIIVPLVIDNRGELEKAFSYQLFGNEIEEHSVLLNFRSSWKKFKTYSLIEYFELVQKHSPVLNYLKNKTVLIGMSDPQIASTIQTAFDDELPGVALHAFALDNLMNSRWINRDFYLVSGILFVLFLLGLILVQPKIKAKPVLFYVFSFGMFLLITFILTFKFNYKLALSFFIFPFLFVLIADALLFVFEKRKLLHGVLDESEVLKRLLEGKQNELLKLQNELDITEESGSYGLIEKIRTLKTEIDRFKEDEKDKIKADIYLSEEVKEFHGIVYGSKAMDKVVDVIKKAAPENATILIIGESGTGKELVANAIHSLSARKDNNFIAVNCAALTESLLESELFGHVKGAFTGANNDKIGKFEAADKGTIFLDEIGETSENFQVKLLRVLQSGEIEKVGSARQSHADVRVVAATNKNLDLAVKEKKFREDLYYRLNVIQINLPPLRERKEDINILALHFLSEEDPEISLSRAAANAIVEYDWKGNVRELESVIKRAVIFSKSEGRKMLQLSDFPKEIVKNIKYDFEDLVLESLRNKKFSHSSISDTAKELGNVNRTMIAENFRGIVFRTLCENNFDVDASIDTITGNESYDVKEKVSSKIQMFINNIENDIKKAGSIEYSEVKFIFASKYKNLPAKFHSYLDEVIKWKLNESTR